MKERSEATRTNKGSVHSKLCYLHLALKELCKLPVLVEEKEKTTPKNFYKPD